MRRHLLCALSLLAACAPAATPSKPVVVPPAAHAAPKAPLPPSNARWVIAHPQHLAIAEIELGDGAILQVSHSGQRWRIAKDGSVTDAEFLLPEPIVDLRRESGGSSGRVLFVGKHGGLFVSDDPLGLPRRVSVPGDREAGFAAGARAVMGMEADGILHRTLDLGGTWTEGRLPLRPGEVADDIVGNTRGEWLVLVHPQRALLSTDDGVTWAPLPTPGIGMRSLARDLHGDLWLHGSMADRDAKLLAGPARLEIAKGFAEPIRAKSLPPSDPGDRKVLVGDRLVSFARREGRIEIRAGALDAAALGTPLVIEEKQMLATRVGIAGYGKTVVVSVHDKDAKTVATRLFRTTDGGIKWDDLGTVDGAPASEESHLLVLPGWIAIGAMCLEKKKPCEPPRFRADGGAWQPLGIPETAKLLEAVYDAAEERVLLVTREEKSTALYAGARNAPLARVNVQLPSDPWHATSIDDDGTLRLAFTSPPRIMELRRDLHTETTRFLPFHVYFLELTGRRGYAWSYDRAWETADGGEHWTATGVAASDSASCTASGCLQGSSIRIGWDLPDPAKALVASLPSPIKPATVSPTGPPPAPTAITCKVSGAFQKYPGTFAGHDTYGLDGAVRFAVPVMKEGESDALTVARGAAAPKRITMLPARKAKDARISSQTHAVDSTGAIFTRFSYVSSPSLGANKQYNPVDVDLGWYSAKTGKSRMATLPQVKPFRVGRSTTNALTAIVDGGLAFLAHGGSTFLSQTGVSPLYYVRDDGKVETLPRPIGIEETRFTDVIKVGNRWVLGQVNGKDIALTTTTDGGKTWTTVVWTLGVGQPLLTVLDGKPVLALLGDDAVVGLVPLTFDGGVSPNDPPPLVPVAHVPQLDVGRACATSGVRMHVDEHVDHPVVIATVTGAAAQPVAIPASSGVMRVRGDGTTCTDLLYGTHEDDAADPTLYLAPADPTHATVVRNATDETFEAAPAACTLP